MISFLLIVSTASAATCKTLILSGGGSYGAYEAGALKGLVDNLPVDQVGYNNVIGISAGSINGLGISQFPMGEEVAATSFLENVWLTFGGKESVMKEWPGGIAAGFLLHNGLYDTSPLQETLNKILYDTINRNISTGTVDAATGNYHLFDETLGRDEMVDAVMCSSAIPGMFPMHYFQGKYWMDGGTISTMDVKTGIVRCLQVADEEDITVDIVSVSPVQLLPADIAYTTASVNSRADDIRNYEKLVRILQSAIQTYPDADFRYYIMPTQNLVGSSGLDFTQQVIEANLGIGYEDGKKAAKSLTDTRSVIKSMKDLPIVFP